MGKGFPDDYPVGQDSRGSWLFATVPAGMFLCAVLFWPLVDTFVTSISEPVVGLGNYVEFFSSQTYLRILFRTIVMAGLITVLCLLIGYPYAYLMTLVGTRWRILMVGAVLVPFWTSAVVRTFAWMVILQPSGIVNRFIGLFGLGPYYIVGSLPGVIIAMTQVMLPMMILPLFSSLSTIDRRLLMAANGLGSSPFRAFRRAYLPLSMPGIVAGCVIVFVSSLGFYLIPQLLGSPQQQLLSQLIVDQVSTLLDFGLGSTMAVVLFTATILVLLVSRRFATRTSGYGSAVVLSAQGANTLSGRRPYGLAVFSIFVAILLVVPALILVPLSFTAKSSFVFPPESWSMRWYLKFFTDSEWLEAMIASLQIAVLTTVLATLLGTLAALGVVRARSAYGRIAYGLIMIPRLIPNVIVAISVYAVFLVIGLTSTITGFVLVHTALAIPFVVITVAAGLESFDEGLELAAAGLGSGPVRRFFRITLPLILPSIASGAVFAFIISFDEIIVSLFLQGPFLQTLPVKMFSSIQDRIDPTIAAASTLILCIATGLILVSLVLGRKNDSYG